MFCMLRAKHHLRGRAWMMEAGDWFTSEDGDGPIITPRAG